MKKENILVVAIICAVIAGGMIYNNLKSVGLKDFNSKKETVQTSDATTINFQEYAQGRALAKTQEKHIFLYFHADWCTYCRKLTSTTFQGKEVLAYLKDNFISISVDTDQNKELADQWKVKGLPTLWFLKSDSTKIDSIPGYVDKRQFLHILKYIHTQSYDKMSFSEFIKTI
ncbi:MAG: thioredoxin family protein [Proteobacteria bacterium]|nr:thioredoxin family protein [Pseudomonadota bacterium]MBU1583678.1 thioredoxin family protein [Pseudomonadota bacterium]MBU2630670.1 thioredoxin family protein [Pseudomonadota bacterium]